MSTPESPLLPAEEHYSNGDFSRLYLEDSLQIGRQMVFNTG